MEIIIGRKGDQPFTISEKTVSSRHLKLTTLSDGNVQVEDLGSSNGTFIDDVRIIKKTVGRNTIVRMGPTYTFCIKDVIPVVEKPKVPKAPEAPVVNQEIISKFKQLEAVWEKYQQDKIKLQKDNAVKGFLRMMPLFLLGATGYAISCAPELAAYRTPLIVAGLVLGVVITWISFKSAANLPEKMERLNQQFQIDYVCPKCKQFLGFIPFEGLKNRGQCAGCKSKWVE